MDQEALNSKASTSWPSVLDAMTAAPDHHRVILENGQVRVLDTRVAPGGKTPIHTHPWPSVLNVMSWSDFIRYDPQGNVLVDSRSFTGLVAIRTRRRGILDWSDLGILSRALGDVHWPRPGSGFLPYTPQQNGLCERFNRSFKEEYAWLHRFANIQDARAEVVGYIDHYNHERPHQPFDYRTPHQAFLNPNRSLNKPQTCPTIRGTLHSFVKRSFCFQST